IAIADARNAGGRLVALVSAVPLEERTERPDSSHVPMLRHLFQPRHAGVLHRGIGLEVADHTSSPSSLAKPDCRSPAIPDLSSPHAIGCGNGSGNLQRHPRQRSGLSRWTSSWLWETTPALTVASEPVSRRRRDVEGSC